MRKEIEYNMYHLETSNKIILLLPNGFHRYSEFEFQKSLFLTYLVGSNRNKIHVFIAQRHSADLQKIINLLSEIRNKRKDIRIIIHCPDVLIAEFIKIFHLIVKYWMISMNRSILKVVISVIGK